MNFFKKTTLVTACLFSTSSLAIETQSLYEGVTKEELVATLMMDAQIAYQNVSYTGSYLAAGLFSKGLEDGLGIESGLILSTGRIDNAANLHNTCYKTTTVNRRRGDYDIAALTGGAPTYDAAILEFDFMPEGNQLMFKYLYGSEEYGEWVNSNFSDVFGFFINGQNIALVPHTTQAVSANSINNQVNAQLYRDNAYPSPPVDNLALYNATPCEDTVSTQYKTEFDGFTAVLTATADVTPGVWHHVKLVIADTLDFSIDSVVLIQGKSFTSTPMAEDTPLPSDLPDSIVTCKLYVVDDRAVNDAQFLVIDEETRDTQPLGSLYQGYDIEALHVHPITKQLYAASASNAAAPQTGGLLYQVNRDDGTLTTLGAVKFTSGESLADIRGLAFNPSTGIVWGWEGQKGLFRLDPDNRLAELRWASKRAIEDLTWNDEGNQLYFAQGDRILLYEGTEAGVKSVCTLPQRQKIEALETLSDTLLLLSLHNTDQIYQLDLTTLDQTTVCALTPYISTIQSDIEGIARICK
jgi:hypothetical protein